MPTLTLIDREVARAADAHRRWVLHAKRWRDCQECELCAQRARVVLARGVVPCDVLFLGEAPGESEDSNGVPFDGPAGAKLDEIVGAARAACAVPWVEAYTNVVCCFPAEAKKTKDHRPDPEYLKDAGGGQVEWELRLPHEVMVDGFIVDETSMVSAEIDRDLRSFGLPIIYVGDHGQLEPVGSAETGFCIMRDPDVALEKIHRNAGEIARFAEHLRKGESAGDWRENGGQVSIITGDQLAECGMEAADQIVCAYNRTRNMLNDAVRNWLGLPRGEPVVGDRVICLQNDREQRLFNGMQGRLTMIDPARRKLSFEDEDGQRYEWIRYAPEAFGAERAPKRVMGVVPFDWAYCVTCHKMQGSEADDVVVMEQRCDLWEHARWAYTAASRAKRRLTWVLG